jgi:hypothetical protein
VQVLSVEALDMESDKAPHCPVFSSLAFQLGKHCSGPCRRPATMVAHMEITDVKDVSVRCRSVNASFESPEALPCGYYENTLQHVSAPTRIRCA